MSWAKPSQQLFRSHPELCNIHLQKQFPNRKRGSLSLSQCAPLWKHFFKNWQLLYLELWGKHTHRMNEIRAKCLIFRVKEFLRRCFEEAEAIFFVLFCFFHHRWFFSFFTLFLVALYSACVAVVKYFLSQEDGQQCYPLVYSSSGRSVKLQVSVIPPNPYFFS